MIIVKIPYLGDTNIAVRQAIEMINWCKENGLVHSKHFDWSFMNHLKEIHFRFYSDEESLATMFALFWNR